MAAPNRMSMLESTLYEYFQAYKTYGAFGVFAMLNNANVVLATNEAQQVDGYPDINEKFKALECQENWGYNLNELAHLYHSMEDEDYMYLVDHITAEEIEVDAEDIEGIMNGVKVDVHKLMVRLTSNLGLNFKDIELSDLQT